jgi:biotin carboxylase
VPSRPASWNWAISLLVWFNETYRGTYQLIGLLRAAGHDLTVLGSHRTASTPFLQACDARVEEPSAEGDAFVDAALDLCRRAGVDVFVPGRNMGDVARRESEFVEAGVAVQVSPPDAIATLAGKTTTYAASAALGVEVPRTRTVTDLDGYRAAVAELSELTGGAQLCFKPDLDFGGHGFRVLDERADTFAEITAPPSVRISSATAERLLGSVETFPALVVSEYLEGDEVSVDCLSDASGRLLTALPRRKSGLEWTRELVDDADAIGIARRMVEGFGLRYLSNVQVRYRHRDGRREPVLLEVNTRAASGLYQSCLAGEVNLPDAALRLTLGEQVAVPQPAYGRSVIVYNEAMPFPRTAQRSGAGGW